MASSKREASLLREYYTKLVQAIVNPIIPVANALYSEGLIDKSTQLDAALTNTNPVERASKLLNAVERVVELDAEKFSKFLSILKEQQSTESLIEEIEEKLASLKTSEDRPTSSTDQNSNKTEEKEGTYSYCPAVKGIGTVLCLSLLMWMMCMFFYQFEVPADYPTPFEALRNTPDDTIKCHPLTNPSKAFDELYNEISDALMLGVHLGLPKVRLEIIERENRSEREKLIDVLHTCHNLDICPCWENIVNALAKYGNVRKSVEIKNKYINDKIKEEL